MCSEPIKIGEMEEVTQECVVKQAGDFFFSVFAPFQEGALTQNPTCVIPSKIPANGNSSQRGIRRNLEKWSRIEEL